MSKLENSKGFKPITIPYGKGKSMLFKNRYMIPPMVCWKSEGDGFVNNYHIHRYNAFAMGGFGSIIIGVTSVENRGDLGLWKDEQVPKFKELIESLHDEGYKGIKIGVQIGHAGRKSSTEKPFLGRGQITVEKGGTEVVSSSPIPFSPKDKTPRELLESEVVEIQQKFVDTALRAKKAGVDFIEIHGAHGYLINQFLCSSTNQRKDKYGGSFENRTRFLLEIVEKVTKALGDFPIFVRLSCDEVKRKMKDGDDEYNKKIKTFNENRWTIKDTLLLVKELKKAGVCLIDCSSGGMHIDADYKDCKPLWQVKFSHSIKKEFGDSIKTSCVGLITTETEVEEILSNGRADFVQIGRAALANPYICNLHAEKLGGKSEKVGDLFVPSHNYAIKVLWKFTDKK